MTAVLVFIILAIIFFVLDGFRVVSPRVNWTPLAWACLVVAVLLLPHI